MALSLVRLCLLSVWIFCAVPSDSISPVLPTIVSAVGKIIKYYQSNFHELNLDGLFGLRVLEGQLMMLSDEHSKGRFEQIPADVAESIRHYRSIASEVSRLAIKHVREDDEEYFNSMAYVVAHPWVFQHAHRRTDPSMRWGAEVYKLAKNIELSESSSDGCMGEITGNNQPNKQGCQISTKCVRIMTQRGLTSYGITHQLLWSMLGEKAGCRPQMEKLLAETEFKNLDRFRQEFCTNNYYEMYELVHSFLNGTITPKYQDLFLEQQFVCPNLGYGEFLSLDYLKDILMWQKEDGCFGKMPQVQNPTYVNIPKFEQIRKAMDSDYDYEDDTDIQQQQQQEAVVNEQNVVHMEAGAGHQQISDRDNKVKLSPDRNSKMEFKKRILKKQPFDRHSHDAPADQTVKSRKEQPVKFSQHVEGGARKLLSVGEHDRVLFGHKDNYYMYVQSGPRRKLLVEKQMSGGCLSHKTAVAAGALVMYLRYLIDPGNTGLDQGTGSIKLVDPGKKRDILQQDVGLGEDPEGKRDGLQQEVGQMEDPLDRGEQYQGEAGEDGDEDDDYDDGDDGEEYGDDREAKLAGRNLIHMKHMGPGENKPQAGYRYENAGDLDNDNNYKGDNQQNNDEEYPYYDETEDEKKLRNKVKIRELPKDIKQSHEQNRPAKSPHLEPSAGPVMKSMPEVKGAERTMVVIFFVCFVVLFLFMFRFIKKRRIQIRYHTRTIFGL